jgi:hypothetical protein
MTEHAQFIYADGVHGGNAFALRVVTDGGSAAPPALRFNLFDHLGSVTAVSDETGQVTGGDPGDPTPSVLSYDACGGRRNVDGTGRAGRLLRHAHRRQNLYRSRGDSERRSGKHERPRRRPGPGEVPVSRS